MENNKSDEIARKAGDAGNSKTKKMPADLSLFG
jgi:hypothetical protein